MGYFVTNRQVAWEIDRRIGWLFSINAYLAPLGWFVVTNLDGKWQQGDCGEWRKLEERKRQVKKRVRKVKS